MLLFKKAISRAVFVLALLSTYSACAVDVFVFPKPGSDKDHRNGYTRTVVREVLKRTERDFGPFRLEYAGEGMERDRKFYEIKSGKLINIAAMPTSSQWEQTLLPVMIPIDMGVESWRISLIDEKNSDSLRAVDSLDELKKLRVGVGRNWVTHSQMEKEGFNVVSGSNYDGLFSMLMTGRFDYLPRSMKDVFVEFDERKLANPTLAVEDSFVLYQPFLTLFFVSPTQARLAKRLTVGMEAMLKDGSLQRTMLRFHGAQLRRANLCTRRVFTVEHSDISPALMNRKELWFDPLDPKNGLCPRNRTSVQSK